MSSLSVGIVGLPNSGKSTLFNALLGRQIAQVAEYPYTTIEPNTGVVEVPDQRLKKLAEIIKPDPSAPSTLLRTSSLRTAEPKVVPAAIKFIDIAGLVKGANLGEGLGNKFLGHIREVEAILHIVRVFKNEKVAHVMGEVNPQRDIEVVNQELEVAGIKKPVIYVLNVGEEQLKEEFPIQMLKICAKLEAELDEFSPPEQKEYLKELGVDEASLDKVIRESYKLLDLLTFFTIKGGKQIQAWPLKKGKTALEAAALVHTDFAQNFIKAEVIPWDKLVEVGSWSAAREKGWIKTVGRDEIVNDGEVLDFKI